MNTNDIIEIAGEAGATIRHTAGLFELSDYRATHFGFSQEALTKFAELIQARAWLPIETAPEYTEVIVWPYPTEYCMTAEYGQMPGKPKKVCWHYAEQGSWGVEYYECHPTRWMPLPTPPAAQKGSV